jgi:hypothetical protein
MKLDGLKKLVKEELAKAISDKNGRVYLRGIENMIKKHPELPLQDIVNSTLSEKGVSSLGELSIEDAMNLNIKIQNTIASTQPSPKPTPSNINPYEMPGGKRKGYMGATYTGD